MSCACFYAQKAADIAGYHSPSSGDSPEKIYATPSYDDRELYSESPPRKSLSPASKKAFEEELDALSSHSSDPEGPEDPGDTEGKSIEEIRAWCAQYERKQKMERIERQRAGIAGIYDAILMYNTCTDVMLAAIRAMAARASTPQTLARKRSKGYAPRIVAAGTYPTTSDDEEVIVINETGAPPAGISRRISPLTMPRRAGKARGAPAVALKSKPSILSPPSAAPPPAKVSPPLKSPVPVIDARLRISCSKVPPLLSALH